MTDITPEIVDLEPQEAVAVWGEVALADLGGFFAQAFGQAAEAAVSAGAEITGPPFGLYPETPTDTVVVEAGFPVSVRVEPSEPAHRLGLPGGRAVQVVHVGPYDALEQTYAALEAWMTEHDLVGATQMWECYLSDPEAEPDPATWRTLVVRPLA